MSPTLVPPLPPFLLLDLDDTILDYTSMGKLCWEQLCQAFAPRLGTVSPDVLFSTLRQVADWYWSDMERHRLGRLDLKASRREVVRLTLDRLHINRYEVGDELADAFTVQREELIHPFAGAIDTLREFQQRGVRMALLTNGNAAFQRAKIQRFGLAVFFETILIESEFGAGKPDERIFRHALEKLGAAPIQACMIGDDLLRDLQPAQGLGMQTVWVDNDRKGLPPGSPVSPTHIVHALVELLS
jgi:putative hydrolase of the HAD superfamily